MVESGSAAPGRYDGIELGISANNNVIAGNKIRRGSAMRQAIGIGPGCVGNQVLQNEVSPYRSFGRSGPPGRRGDDDA